MKTNLIKAALFTPLRGTGRWGLPLLLWGEPGVAKTSVVEEVCARFGLPCETLSPGERGEGAFGVVPVPTTNGVLSYPRPDWTEKFDKLGRGVVFVDELTTAAPAIQAPLLGLFLARRVGGYQLPGGVRTMAAANPPELAAGGYELASSLANRVGHVEWPKPSTEEHVAFMLRGDADTETEATLDAETEEARVEKAWPETFARSRGLEVAFITRRPHLKNQCPKAEDPKASRAWASDRAWEAATRAHASASVHGLAQAEREEFVASFIGEGVAGEWFAFEQEQDLADPAMVLDGKEKFTHTSSRLDRTAALLAGCAALVTPTKAPKRKERADAMWSLLATLITHKSDMDVFVPACKAMCSAKLFDSQDVTPVMKTVLPLLKASGINSGAMF
jgi:MoxR-like ATPase